MTRPSFYVFRVNNFLRRAFEPSPIESAQVISAYISILAKVDLLYWVCQSGSPAGGLYEM